MLQNTIQHPYPLLPHPILRTPLSWYESQLLVFHIIDLDLDVLLWNFIDMLSLQGIFFTTAACITKVIQYDTDASLYEYTFLNKTWDIFH